jgi:hypothetical protein
VEGADHNMFIDKPKETADVIIKEALDAFN